MPVVSYTANAVIVNIGLPATHFTVSGYPTSATAGVAETVTVTALDTDGNVGIYTGTVTLTSSDPQAAFGPASYTFTGNDHGVHTFAATLETAGTQSITVADASNGLLASASNYSISASETGIVVSANTMASLLVAGYATSTAGRHGQRLYRHGR